LDASGLAVSPGVILLPPIGSALELAGDLDPYANVSIEIFELTGGAAAGLPVGPSLSTSAGSVVVTNEPGVEEHYQAVWDTRHSARPDWTRLRVEIRSWNANPQAAACNAGPGIAELGCIAFFDVELRPSHQGGRPPRKTPTGIMPLVNGRALPIRFHIETGVIDIVGPAGGVITGVDGVGVSVPAGALTETVSLVFERVPNPPEALPVGFEPVTSMYRLGTRNGEALAVDRASLVLGIPVPQDTDPRHLALAAWIPENWVLDLPDAGWDFSESVYDNSTGRLLTQVFAIPPEGLVFSIVASQAFTTYQQEPRASSSAPVQTAGVVSPDDMYLAGGFAIQTNALDGIPTEVVHKWEHAFNAVQEVFEYGAFKPFRLRTVGYVYDYVKHTYDFSNAQYSVDLRKFRVLGPLDPRPYLSACTLNPNLQGKGGAYNPSFASLTVCVDIDNVRYAGTEPNLRTIRHELLHAVQARYTLNFALWFYTTRPWVLEGTAELAEMSMQDRSLEVRRSPLDYRPVDVSLFSDASDDAYQAQDFWSFVATGDDRRRDFTFVNDFFSSGFTASSVNRVLEERYDTDLSAMYWDWVKWQALSNKAYGTTFSVAATAAEPNQTTELGGGLSELTSRVIEITLDNRDGLRTRRWRVEHVGGNVVRRFQHHESCTEICVGDEWAQAELTVEVAPGSKAIIHLLLANNDWGLLSGASPGHLEITQVDDVGVPVEVPLIGVVPGEFDLEGGSFTLTVWPRDDDGNFVDGEFTVGDFEFEDIRAELLESGALRSGTAVPTHVTKITPDVTGDVTLVLAFDASGSMISNDRDRLRVSAGKRLVDLLSDKSEAAILEFASSTRVLQAFTADKPLLKSAIDLVGQSGLTYMYSALETALSLLTAKAGPNPAIVVLTDGAANDGSKFAGVVVSAVNQRIPIMAVGLGDGVNATELQRLAQMTNGTYAAASDAAALEEVFWAVGAGVTQGRILVEGQGSFASTLPGPGQYRISGTLITHAGDRPIHTPFSFDVLVK